MAITSQIGFGSGVGEVTVSEWQRANLLKPSAIKPVFATLEQRLIIRRLGILQAQDQSALRAAIAAVLG
jgi:mRNA interferase MazF